MNNFITKRTPQGVEFFLHRLEALYEKDKHRSEDDGVPITDTLEAALYVEVLKDWLHEVAGQNC